jgi:energy-coupling factor transporter ATP-binding protein EcfA2
MTSGRKPDERWAKLRAKGEQFTTQDALALGISRPVLSQALARGQVRRIARGSYAFASDYPRGPAAAPRRATPLSTLTLQNFSVFADATFEFCPGVNVLIGENGTGKSHAMLAAYSMLRALHKGDASSTNARIPEKLKGVFQPEKRQLGRLVRRARGGGEAKLELTSSAYACTVAFTHRETEGCRITQTRRRSAGPSTIFMPSREPLAMYEGFIGAYQHSELSFSEVYYDTCVALNAPLTKGARKAEAQQLLAPLLDALGGRVFEQGGRFYVQQGSAHLEAHLVSEGLRKLATLTHLINNGSLDENDILFWDEPEANLNPALSKIVVHFLVELAKRGVQVILATHDYAVTTRLSILAENRVVEPNIIRFFSLARTHGKTGPVVVAHADTLAGLPYNPILDEHEALYDFELAGGRP